VTISALCLNVRHTWSKCARVQGHTCLMRHRTHLGGLTFPTMKTLRALTLDSRWFRSVRSFGCSVTTCSKPRCCRTCCPLAPAGARYRAFVIHHRQGEICTRNQGNRRRVFFHTLLMIPVIDYTSRCLCVLRYWNSSAWSECNHSRIGYFLSTGRHRP